VFLHLSRRFIMVMEARALEARHIGHHEVRITNVYTVEAGHEASGKHDPTPNWTERGTPSLLVDAFRLRIEAEAGRSIVENAPPYGYNLIIQAACLTNPRAVLVGNLEHSPLRGGVIAEVFDGAWEYDASEDKYTKSWSIHFPHTVNLFDSPGFPFDEYNQVDEIWQFFVSLEHNAVGAKAFGCTATSEPFHLLPVTP
jgi:hypothetical protein